MEQKPDKPVSIEKLNEFLCRIFPNIKTDWELSQDGTAVVSDLLDPAVAKKYKQQLHQMVDLKDHVEFLGYNRKLRIIIPVQILLRNLPQDAVQKIF